MKIQVVDPAGHWNDLDKFLGRPIWVRTVLANDILQADQHYWLKVKSKYIDDIGVPHYNCSAVHEESSNISIGDFGPPVSESVDVSGDSVRLDIPLNILTVEEMAELLEALDLRGF